MGYAQGINARAAFAYETTYGTTPGSSFFYLPFVSTTIGEERPLIEDDTLGNGREGLDPSYDVATNDGDFVVPVDDKTIVAWLTMLLGTPATTTPSEGLTQRVWTSGSSTLPSVSCELQSPEVPSYSAHYGLCVNSMQIGMSRSGLLNATMGCIAQGQTVPAGTSVAGTPTSEFGTRFSQASGSIKKNGTSMAGVTAAAMTFSNGLDKIESIRSDGRIEGVLPGAFRASGSVTARFANHDLITAASAGTPVALEFGWTRATSSLVFALPRVLLPLPKRTIEGPRGIMATYNWQASGQAGHQLTATLVTGA